jgi:hypothetical protein
MMSMTTFTAGMPDRPDHQGNLRAAPLDEAERTLREEGIGSEQLELTASTYRYLPFACTTGLLRHSRLA